MAPAYSSPILTLLSAAAIGLFRWLYGRCYLSNKTVQWQICSHQTSPACQGLGAVDNVTSIPSRNRNRRLLNEVGCGIKLSLCSTVCPSGTIHTSFRPDLSIRLLGGTSAAPLLVGLPFERICRPEPQEDSKCVERRSSSACPGWVYGFWCIRADLN